MGFGFFIISLSPVITLLRSFEINQVGVSPQRHNPECKFRLYIGLAFKFDIEFYADDQR